MEEEKYPEFSKENEEVAASSEVRQKFNAEEYERTSKQYKKRFFISLITLIALFMVDIADLIWLLSSGKNFTGFDFFILVGLLILDVLDATYTVRFYNRWKSYE